jgi:hypothetical protein
MRFTELRRVQELKDAGMDFVEIPVYGATTETHKTVMHGKTATIENIAKVMKNLQQCGVDVFLTTAITRANILEIVEIYTMAERLLGPHLKKFIVSIIFIPKLPYNCQKPAGRDHRITRSMGPPPTDLGATEGEDRPGIRCCQRAIFDGRGEA